MLGSAPTPFGRPWDELELADVSAFFAAAEDEGLTWEAKGTTIRPEHVRRAASAFGNSLLGGYLVLGATRDARTREWTLDGWRFPEEPTLWVTSCLANDGVRPLPSFDTRPWPVGEGRHVAVVSFRPSPVPPVITRDGQVWERLSSASRQVADPTSLRRIFERGETALQHAVAVSHDAATDLIARPPADQEFGLVLSMAAAGVSGDAFARIFRQRVYDEVREILLGPLRVRHGLLGNQTQGAFTLWNSGLTNASEGYAIRVGRHGGVAVGVGAEINADALRAVVQTIDVLRPSWDAAARILLLIAGEGPAHASMYLASSDPGLTEIARSLRLPGPWEDELGSIQREARRALGLDAWEAEER